MIRTARVLSRLVAFGGVLAGATAASLMPVAPAGAEAHRAPPSCEVHPLPLPPGSTGGSLTGSSNDGKTLLGHVTTDGGSQLVLWRDGKIVETFDNPPSGLEDMNTNGVGVGGHYDKWSDIIPWVYGQGEVLELPGEVTPKAINDSGRIVGYRSAPKQNGRYQYVPVTWAPGETDAADLLPEPSGIAWDISENGTIVGDTAGEAPQDGYVWRPDGTSGPLPRPEGTAPKDDLSAYRISGPWVIGASPGGALRWNLDTGAAETITGVNTVENTAINDRGWFVGTQSSGERAVLVADGERVILPAFDGGGYVHYAHSITSDGSVIGGNAVIPKGPSKPVYWTCS